MRPRDIFGANRLENAIPSVDSTVDSASYTFAGANRSQFRSVGIAMQAVESFERVRTDNTSRGYVSERFVGGAIYTLPDRRLGKARWFGALLVAGGLLFATMLAAWMAVPMVPGWRMIQGGDAFGWLLCAFGCLALAGVNKCVLVIVAGLAIVKDRTSCKIEIRDEKLLVHELFFQRKWTRKISTPLSEFRHLRVGPARVDGSLVEDEYESSMLADFDSAIFASVGKGKPMAIADCYPKPMLDKLARDLVGHMKHVGRIDREESASDAIRPANEFDGTPRTHTQYIRKPEFSEVEVDTRSDGVTFRIPAAGLRKGSKGLFGFAVFWNAFVLAFLLFAMFLFLRDPQGANLIMALVAIPFVGVGIGTALAVMNMGWRKTAIVTAGDQVFVISEGIFGKKTRTWHAADLKYVVTGPSGLSVNDVPVKELQFHSGNGKFGVLSERTDDELLWLSVEVSQQLGLMQSEVA